MARQVAVLFIHGIRTDGQDYSLDFQRRLRASLPKPLRDYFIPAEVVWSDIVRNKQNNYLSKLESRGIRPKAALREFVIQGLGDAAAYNKPSSGRAGAYYEIQDRIWSKLGQLESTSDAERPLVIVAHSLGCHIMSSFLWDVRKLRCLAPEQRADQRYQHLNPEFTHLDRGTPLKRLETVAGIVTFGNNMPIFAFTYPGADVYTINSAHRNMPPAFPGERVSGQALDAARWINIYSKRDPLGYPLEPLSSHYENDARVRDMPCNVEGPLSLPVLGMIDAHTKYWRSGFVVRQTADLVRDLIQSG